MPDSAIRRLPGIRFEPRPAQLPDALPRMDVAVFVGFAASGPLHTPVPVESAAQFAAIFGEDAPLAWDAERGEVTTALLGASVRAFFANGGLRCWIVRVAGAEASSDHFPLPGLLRGRFAGDGQSCELSPAMARARAKGSWADALRVSTALQRRSIRPAAPYDGGDVLWVSPASSVIPAVGDMLRIGVNDDAQIAFARVADVDSPPVSPGPGAIRVDLGPRLSFVAVGPESPGDLPIATKAWIYTQDSSAADDTALVESPASGFETEVAATLTFSGGPPSVLLTLVLQTPPARAPAVGTLLQVEYRGERCWMVVTGLGLAGGDAAAEAVVVRGRGWRPAAGRAPSENQSMALELVTLDLRVRQGAAATYTLRNLGLARGHARYWNLLRTDEAFFGEAALGQQSDAAAAGFELDDLRQTGAPDVPRFPLAGDGDQELLFLPLAVMTLFGEPSGPLSPSRSRLARDGLTEFRAELFIDPDLARTGVGEFIAQADFLRYLAPRPRPLRGIHAALGYQESSIVEEAALISVPDAVHRHWHELNGAWSPPEIMVGTIAAPAWWHVASCIDAPSTSPEIALSRFHDCRARDIPAPASLRLAVPPDAVGTFLLLWSSPDPESQFVLEEANFPDFGDARVVYSGAATSLTLFGRSPGEYFYRVRALVGPNGSPWSPPLAFRIGQVADARFEAQAEYDNGSLLAVHRALLKMCAGRGDLFAVLSLPAHYREADAIAHAMALGGFAETQVTPMLVPPLQRDEARALSYGALYHPWPMTRLPGGEIAPVAPDGAAAGVLAARALERGAWIAPANEPMSEVVGLAPPVRREQWQALQDAQVNLVRQEPRGFLCLSADTLSQDPDLRPIGVRRLLILLRRLALRRGSTYVFEPLSNAFRRLVQRGFETVLFELFQRGAFAGATPATSYQVVTDDPPNTPQDLDQGRFFVELRVAPSLPMRYLSIRLLQSGGQLAVVEGR